MGSKLLPLGLGLLLTLGSCATLAGTLGAASKEEMAAAQAEITKLREENQKLQATVDSLSSVEAQLAEIKTVQSMLLRRTDGLPRETLMLMLEILQKGMGENPKSP